MVHEQFVQDTLCRPDRIEWILRQIGRADWRFFDSALDDNTQPIDVINQEFNFDKGRIDILATFNHRTCLVVVEVKAGIAGMEAVEQLEWYLSNRTKLPLDALKIKVEASDVVGIVLAEDFVDIGNVPGNVVLVAFKFDGLAWPFRIVNPSETISAAQADAPSLTAGKTSSLNTFSDHCDYITSGKLRLAFEEIADCFTEPGDDRRDWILKNAKGSHIAIHYKGEYLIHLWAKKKFFNVGYDVRQRRMWRRIDDNNVETELQQVKADFVEMLSDVDLAQTFIPPGFRWRLFND